MQWVSFFCPFRTKHNELCHFTKLTQCCSKLIEILSILLLILFTGAWWWLWPSATTKSPVVVVVLRAVEVFDMNVFVVAVAVSAFANTTKKYERNNPINNIRQVRRHIAWMIREKKSEREREFRHTIPLNSCIYSFIYIYGKEKEGVKKGIEEII